MKDKRILAMFVTAVVTLVTSLAVTFGILVSLADPVIATGLVKYDYNFNGTNDRSLIYQEGNTLSMVEDITFQPTSSVDWVDREVVWPNSKSYEDKIWYNDESISTKIKVAPIRITNNFDVTLDLNLRVEFEKSSVLGRYTFVKLYNYQTGEYEDASSKTILLEKNSSVEYLVIIYANENDNLTENRIDWGHDYITVNVKVTNNLSEITG